MALCRAGRGFSEKGRRGSARLPRLGKAAAALGLCVGFVIAVLGVAFKMQFGLPSQFGVEDAFRVQLEGIGLKVVGNGHFHRVRVSDALFESFVISVDHKGVRIPLHPDYSNLLRNFIEAWDWVKSTDRYTPYKDELGITQFLKAIQDGDRRVAVNPSHSNILMPLKKEGAISMTKMNSNPQYNGLMVVMTDPAEGDNTLSLFWQNVKSVESLIWRGGSHEKHFEMLMPAFWETPPNSIHLDIHSTDGEHESIEFRTDVWESIRHRLKLSTYDISIKERQFNELGTIIPGWTPGVDCMLRAPEQYRPIPPETTKFLTFELMTLDKLFKMLVESSGIEDHLRNSKRRIKSSSRRSNSPGKSTWRL